MRYIKHDEIGRPEHEFLRFIEIRRENHPCVFLLDDPKLFDLEESVEVGEINAWFQKRKVHTKPKWGDIIISPKERYRNTDLWIIDRDECNRLFVTELDFNIDEYGSLPKQFYFPHFPLNYWTGIIDHNNYVWISDYFCDRLIENVMIGKCPALLHSMYEGYLDVWSTFSYEDQTYWVIALTEMLSDNNDWSSEDLKNTFLENIKKSKWDVAQITFETNPIFGDVDDNIREDENIKYGRSDQNILFMTCYWD